eukprot:c23363_g1_i1 orf=494-931(-)
MAEVEEAPDIFESSLSLEDSHLRQGFDDGFRDGLEAGRAEGREAGRKAGFEIGEEVGFYTGCVDIWKAVLVKDPHAFSARSQRTIKLLEEQLRVFVLSKPGDSQLGDLLDMIRARFRAILSLLSIQIHYDGRPRESVHDGSFASF